MKVITVPLSKEAETRLDYDENMAGDLHEISISQEDFDKLWGVGLFTELNTDLDILIDEYEDEKIIGDNIDRAVKIINGYIQKHVEILDLLNNFKKALILAKENSTGVYFFF